MSIDTALKERRNRKAKKPTFDRQDAHKKREIARSSWRKPRGLHSKVRLGKRGYRRAVSPGYSSPKAVKGLTREGLLPVLVATAAQLSAIDAKKECAVLKAGLGDRRKEELLKLAKEKRITILNAKDLEAGLKAIAARREAKRKGKAERAAKKEKKPKKALEEKAKAAEEAAPSEEEKKEAEEAEKQKVLTQRQ